MKGPLSLEQAVDLLDLPVYFITDASLQTQRYVCVVAGHLRPEGGRADVCNGAGDFELAVDFPERGTGCAV